MSDTLEVTLTVDDEKVALEAISKDPREFGVWMREVLTGRDSNLFDSARWHLREEFGVSVTSTRKVFR